jgi:hypothetical protein
MTRRQYEKVGERVREIIRGLQLGAPSQMGPNFWSPPGVDFSPGISFSAAITAARHRAHDVLARRTSSSPLVTDPLRRIQQRIYGRLRVSYEFLS